MGSTTSSRINRGWKVQRPNDVPARHDPRLPTPVVNDSGVLTPHDPTRMPCWASIYFLATSHRRTAVSGADYCRTRGFKVPVDKIADPVDRIRIRGVFLPCCPEQFFESEIRPFGKSG